MGGGGEVSTSASGVEGAGVQSLVQPQPLLELIRSLALEGGFNPRGGNFCNVSPSFPPKFVWDVCGI